MTSEVHGTAALSMVIVSAGPGRPLRGWEALKTAEAWEALEH